MTDNERFLAFLRFSLDEQADCPDFLEEMDWDGLLEFATRQGIVGVMYYGLNRIPPEASFRPHRKKVALWVGCYEELKKKNADVNKDSAVITSFLYNKYKVKSCILKGQGNLAYYPDPYMRTPGDIDLWTDQDEVSIAKIIYSIKKDSKLDYHHVELSGLINTPLEVHLRPSFMVNIWFERRLDHYFNQVKDEQFHNFFVLPGNHKICIPEKGFNRIFQLSHLMHHFFGPGLGLRQIIDYYYLLRSGFSEQEREETMRTVRYLHMEKFTAGIMWLLHDMLGLDKKYLLIEPDEAVGKVFRKELMKTDSGIDLNKNKWSFFISETKRNFSYVRFFPAEAIWGRPIARVFFAWHKWRLRRKIKET